MTDDEPKSAWELAMERFRKQDVEQGAVGPPLTEEQKAAIEECRRSHKARIAELEIMRHSKLPGIQDAESLETLERNYRRDIERAAEERDRAIAKIRAGK